MAFTRVLWGGAFWSPSYCFGSRGGAPLDVIKEYVENQNMPDRDLHGAAKRARRREEKKTKG